MDSDILDIGSVSASITLDTVGFVQQTQIVLAGIKDLQDRLTAITFDPGPLVSSFQQLSATFSTLNQQISSGLYDQASSIAQFETNWTSAVQSCSADRLATVKAYFSDVQRIASRTKVTDSVLRTSASADGGQLHATAAANRVRTHETNVARVETASSHRTGTRQENSNLAQNSGLHTEDKNPALEKVKEALKDEAKDVFKEIKDKLNEALAGAALGAIGSVLPGKAGKFFKGLNESGGSEGAKGAGEGEVTKAAEGAVAKDAEGAIARDAAGAAEKGIGGKLLGGLGSLAAALTASAQKIFALGFPDWGWSA